MRGLRQALVVVCLASAGFAADKAADKADNATGNKDEHVYQLSDEGITPPRLIHQVSPDYNGAKGVAVKGSVAVAIIISSEGVPKNPQVVKGLDPEVDRSAVEAIKQWRFAPAEKEKKPVAVKVTVEVQFRSM